VITRNYMHAFAGAPALD